MALVDALRRDFGERSLPTIVSTVCSLCELDTDLVAGLACLDVASVDSAARQHSSTDTDDFTPLFLHVVEVIHDRQNGQTAAKRRRYDDSDDNIATMNYPQPNELWTSNQHRHQQL